MAKRSRGKTPWVIAGLIAFILADLALVGFALRGPAVDSGSVSAIAPTITSVPTAAAQASAVPTVAPSAPASSSAPSTGLPTVAPSTSSTAAPSTPSALTGMASALVGYRSTAGTCSGTSTATDAVIELTTDGGATWKVVNPSDIRIRAVTKMIVVDETHVDLLARYGDACTESDVTTYTQGEFWQVYPDRVAQFG